MELPIVLKGTSHWRDWRGTKGTRGGSTMYLTMYGVWPMEGEEKAKMIRTSATWHVAETDKRKTREQGGGC